MQVKSLYATQENLFWWSGTWGNFAETLPCNRKCPRPGFKFFVITRKLNITQQWQTEIQEVQHDSTQQSQAKHENKTHSSLGESSCLGLLWLRVALGFCQSACNCVQSTLQWSEWVCDILCYCMCNACGYIWGLMQTCYLGSSVGYAREFDPVWEYVEDTGGAVEQDGLNNTSVREDGGLWWCLFECWLKLSSLFSVCLRYLKLSAILTLTTITLT